MTKYNDDEVLYPVVLTPELNDVFVEIPDIPGGFTQGDDDLDAIKMAKDAIGNLLEDVCPSNYPKSSVPNNIKLMDGQKLVYVNVDLSEFRSKHPRTVRRNVTVPEYLNNMAKNQNINVSQLLTEALRKKLKG